MLAPRTSQHETIVNNYYICQLQQRLHLLIGTIFHIGQLREMVRFGTLMVPKTKLKDVSADIVSLPSAANPMLCHILTSGRCLVAKRYI